MYRVVLGGGSQTLYHRPMRDGSPIVVASATLRIVNLHRHEDDPSREILASTSATVDAVSTTISAAAGYSASDPEIVTVASATGITAGRRYLLRSSALVVETVTVEAVSGTTVRLATPVTQTFAASSSFLGFEISGSFPSATANDTDEFDAGYSLYAVDWTYDGRTTRELVTVVRTVSGCPVTGADFRERLPILLPRIGSTYDPDPLLQAAWRSVRSIINRHGLDPDNLVSDDDVPQAVCTLAGYHLLLAHPDEAAVAMRDHLNAEYQRLIGGIVAGVTKQGNVSTDRLGRAKAPEQRRRIIERA